MLRVHCAVLNARTRQLVHTRSQSYGGHGERETPGNIPNPEAKPLSADGTALETGWESRTPPDNTYPKGPQQPLGPLSASHPRTFCTESPRTTPGLSVQKVRQGWGLAAKKRQIVPVASSSWDGGSAA